MMSPLGPIDTVPASEIVAARVIEWNTTTDAFKVKDTGLRIVVGLVCSLSIIGSLLIILSYICFKKRRTRAREILVHISLMDLGVALSNITGLAVYFDQYYYPNPDEVQFYIDNLCKTQAFFAGYTTLSSVFWTMALMAYMYFLILHSRTKLALYFLRFCYVFCYGFSLLIALWLVATNRLGYSPYDSSGWCSLISIDPLNGEVDVFVTVFGNDLWIYLAIFLIPLLYISIRAFIATKVETSKQYASEKQFWLALHNVDYKFLFMPIMFISLRLWTCIINAVYLYGGVRSTDVPYWFNQTLLYLSGIGDSGQGFANAILFVIFSKNVRQNFIRCVTCQKEHETLSVVARPTTSLETGEVSKQLEPSASGASVFGEGSELDYNKEKSTHFHSTYGTVN